MKPQVSLMTMSSESSIAPRMSLANADRSASPTMPPSNPSAKISWTRSTGFGSPLAGATCSTCLLLPWPWRSSHSTKSPNRTRVLWLSLPSMRFRLLIIDIPPIIISSNNNNSRHSRTLLPERTKTKIKTTTTDEDIDVMPQSTSRIRRITEPGTLIKTGFRIWHLAPMRGTKPRVRSC